jgi:hypothetical protein
MSKNIKQLNYDFKYKDKTVKGEMSIDLKRFEGQYSKAQYFLDSMVMDSMVPYMPMQTGTFINVTRGMSQAVAGSGKVFAAAPPFGRFLYEGKVMVGERTGSAFAEKAVRKVTTERPLQYSRHAHPQVTDHWFDTAKINHGKVWVRKTKEMAGGG